MSESESSIVTWTQRRMPAKQGVHRPNGWLNETREFRLPRLGCFIGKNQTLINSINGLVVLVLTIDSCGSKQYGYVLLLFVVVWLLPHTDDVAMNKNPFCRHLYIFTAFFASDLTNISFDWSIIIVINVEHTIFALSYNIEFDEQNL